MIQAQGEQQINKLKQDTAKTFIAIQALKHENKELRKRIVPVRKEVEQIADTVAIIKQYLGLTDSLDIVQEAEIDTLSAEKIRTWKSFNSILDNKDEQIKVALELNNHFDQLNQQLSKDVKYQRLRKNFWKYTAAVAVGGLIFSAVNR